MVGACGSLQHFIRKLSILEKEVPLVRRVSEHLAQVIVNNPTWFCRQRPCGNASLWHIATWGASPFWWLCFTWPWTLCFRAGGCEARMNNSNKKNGCLACGGQSMTDMPEDQRPCAFHSAYERRHGFVKYLVFGFEDSLLSFQSASAVH